jgi:allantoinase
MRTRLHNLRLPAGGDATRPGEILVEGGCFSAFGGPGAFAAVSVDETVDGRGWLALPGVIDGHVHFNDPGFTHRETFSHGTRAAAAGGVTCVADMPCTSLPPVVEADSLAVKLAAVAPQAHVDFLCWGGLCANRMEQRPEAWRAELAELAAAGVAAIKVYLLSGMESFRELDAAQLRDAALACRELGLPLGVHAEDAALVRRLSAELQAGGAEGPAAWSAARPAEAERRAVALVARTALATGAWLHVVHLGSAAALEELLAARAAGARLSAETCPQYLAFAAADFERLGSLLKIAPPVKGRRDRERLWQALAAGELLSVATDHAPAEWPREKHTGSIWSDHGGIPGVELLLPYLHSEGLRQGRITLERLTELLCAGPAQLFGIAGRKGALRPGLDADFVLLDPEESWIVRAAELQSLNPTTPFEGATFTGRVRSTWLRGRCIHRREDGQAWFAPPGGRYQRPGNHVRQTGAKA